MHYFLGVSICSLQTNKARGRYASTLCLCHFSAPSYYIFCSTSTSVNYACLSMAVF